MQIPAPAHTARAGMLKTRTVHSELYSPETEAQQNYRITCFIRPVVLLN